VLLLLLVSIRCLCAVHLTTSKSVFLSLLEHTDERKKELDKAQKKKEERDPLSLSFCLSLSLYDSLSRASVSLLRVVRCTEFWEGGNLFPQF